MPSEHDRVPATTANITFLLGSHWPQHALPHSKPALATSQCNLLPDAACLQLQSAYVCPKCKHTAVQTCLYTMQRLRRLLLSLHEPLAGDLRPTCKHPAVHNLTVHAPYSISGGSSSASMKLLQAICAPRSRSQLPRKAKDPPVPCMRQARREGPGLVLQDGWKVKVQVLQVKRDSRRDDVRFG